ncbi:MAG: hypothetical protein A3F13_01460 [Gammaproteobacteria bacterium RIFCSPHIGHO2_12_FULL_40_19]|nr:MAG: hypothetical protein A3F13_01460 [Gammaproteobacteria bacterium RIFCSPHIGHO2_12_FULL_40_19]
MIIYKEPSDPPKIAVIREAECIGCTKCIQACPFDSIMGATKLMHTVIKDICTGCELCVEPCPVDCIDIVSAPEKSSAEKALFSQHARARFEKRNARLQKERIRDREKYLQIKQAGEKNKTMEERKAEIAAILKRVKQGK